jgi:acetyl-CoA C-acetyltransferase
VDRARRLGVPKNRFVYLLGEADLKERPVIERPDLAKSPAAKAAVEMALSVAGLSPADVARFDLYSCFPIAVFNVLDAFGLAPDDPRGFTVTGGLPFFGGAGNNYAMHAIAGMVRALRAAPGKVGLSGANGGYMSKYSVGLYSTTPAPFRPFDSAPLQTRLDAAPPVPLADPFEGAARVESYTIDHDADPPRALVVGRRDDIRIVAATEDEALVRDMADHDPLTAVIEVRATADGCNQVVALD